MLVDTLNYKITKLNTNASKITTISKNQFNN